MACGATRISQRPTSTGTKVCEENSCRSIVSDLIDLGQAGQETLLRGAKGWQKGGLGSPVARTNSSAALTQQVQYDPWGDGWAGTNPSAVGYAGHHHDTTTDLVQMQQRYYDPLIGRFLSPDPEPTNANTGENFNRYWYANNNPYRYTDPDGRFIPLAIAGCAASMVCTTGVITIGAYAVAKGPELAMSAKAVVEALGNIINQETAKANPDGTVTGADGEQVNTSSDGERAGKRFRPETPDEKAAAEGAVCVYCGQKTTNKPGLPNSRQRDHGTAKSKGGDGSPSNENNSCATCNNDKRAKDVWTWVKEKFGSGSN